MSQQPNIVLILADQLRPDILPFYGGTTCLTPALDGLAAESVVFERAYTPLSVCSPARASVLTGLYPHNHGVVGNHSQTAWGILRDHPSLLSRQLAALGYSLWYCGKWHLGGADNLPRQIGFAGQQFPGHGGGGYGYPEYREYLAKKGLSHSLSSGPHQLGWHRYGTLQGPPEVEPSCMIADSALEFLETWGSGDREPFFLYINFWGPHEPYFVPEGFLDLYRHTEIPPWPNFPDTSPNRPRVHQLKMPPESKELGWRFWEPAIRHYLAFMTLIDAQIGRVLMRLRDLGVDDNTMVIFTADHGESIGAHGCQDKGHFMYEETYRIPLLMRCPGVLPRRDAALVSLVDLYPTIMDLVGAAPPRQPRDGMSMLGLLHGAGSSWRRSLAAEFHGLVTPFTQRMVVDERFKYVWNLGDLDECYDLQTDPWELHNLATEPAMQEAVHRLQTELLRWMRENRDGVARYFERHMASRK